MPPQSRMREDADIHLPLVLGAIGLLYPPAAQLLKTAWGELLVMRAVHARWKSGAGQHMKNVEIPRSGEPSAAQDKRCPSFARERKFGEASFCILNHRSRVGVNLGSKLPSQFAALVDVLRPPGLRACDGSAVKRKRNQKWEVRVP